MPRFPERAFQLGDQVGRVSLISLSLSNLEYKEVAVRFLTKYDRWNYRRIFWMVVGLVIGVSMTVVVVGWIVHFLSGSGQ